MKCYNIFRPDNW